MPLEEIPNFPQVFMDRHMTWHMGPADPNGRTIAKGQPGSGAQFLDFHHQFLIDVKNWYATQPGADPSKLDAWTDFPAALAAAHSPELENYRAYASTASNFTTEDALGIYVEAEHDQVHGYIAALYDTPGFGGFDSCMYFMFYQWHGMVDAWRGNWLVHHKSAVKDFSDGPGHKWIIDKARQVDKFHKEFVAEIDPKLIRDTVHKQIPEVPPKSPKELVEVPGGFDPGIDPAAELSDRLARLENVVHGQARQAFIQPQERPAVG
jgi:hypothetical protein